MGEDRGAGRSGYRSSAGLIAGRAVCALGIFFVLAGLAMVVFGDRLGIAPYALGIICGLIGYGLGARRSGVVTIILSVIVMAFILVASRGWVPGLHLPGLILLPR